MNRYIVPKWKAWQYARAGDPGSDAEERVEEKSHCCPASNHCYSKRHSTDPFGWAFNPMSLQTKLGRRVRHQRPDAEWIGKVISRIGAAAGVIVRPAVGDRQPKYASAHDPRRSCVTGFFGRRTRAGSQQRSTPCEHRNDPAALCTGTVQESASIIRRQLAFAIPQP